MDQNEERIGWLLEGYLNNGLTPAERTELFAAISGDESLLGRFTEKLPFSFTGSVPVNVESRQQILSAIFGVRAGDTPVPRIHFQKWRVAAAAVLALLVTGAYFWLRPAAHREIAATQSIDVKPGSNKATLTLADGSSVLLDSAGKQVIQQGTTAIHEQNGQLMYDAHAGNTATIAYNMLVTPRGGQYRVTLPDGTAVWLNTASSLRYPTTFAGKERKVEVTGEAYFEVAKDAGRPFIVKINDQTEIEVLGTHFNVNAYTDEPTINTTLLEGAVNINAYHHAQKLAPGQQARVNTGGGSIRLADDVNTEQVVAWKNGIFDFNQADVQTVMRQIGRWYDVEIVYEKGVDTQEEFIGEMQRSLSLSQVLKGLENMGLKFKIENGRRLIVTPS